MSAISPDWVEILEPRSQERMYVNLATGECGWNAPLGTPVRQADGNQWWELFDPQSGRFYYYNSVGRRTVWHRPPGVDIVPLSQLQAMKRCSEAKRAGGTEEGHHEARSPGKQKPFVSKTVEVSSEREISETEVDFRPAQRDHNSPRDPQRWQPPPGSKAAMLVRVNTVNGTQPGGSASPALQLRHQNPQAKLSDHQAFTLVPVTSKPLGNHACYAQGYKTTPPGKMAADVRHAHHLKKTHNGALAAVPPEPPLTPGSHRSQPSTPRPGSPRYASAPPLYDHSGSVSPIYDEPPVDMEVEGAHLQNGPPLTRRTPTHSLRKPPLLQQPGPCQSGSGHKRNPSASDYSPAGLECIKHMINVDPKQVLLSTSPGPTCSPSPTARPDPFAPQQREPRSPVMPRALEKKQTWRALEASVLKAVEARHSRQGSQASQDFPTPTGTQTAPAYQDSGYSTGPSPNLRRKSRRRAGAPVRPGSVGSSGELCALNEKLMAEMREVVSRSNTMREMKAVGLGSEIGERGAVPRTRSPVDPPPWYGGGRCASREDVPSVSRSLSRLGNHGNPALAPLEMPGRQKRTYEKVDTLEMSVNSQTGLSSPDSPRPPSEAGTLELKAQLDSRKKGMVDGRTASLGPHHQRSVSHDNRDHVEGGVGGRGGIGGSYHQLSYATLRQPPPPDTSGMADWASKHLNMHTQGLFRRRVSIANMLSWNRGSIKKPMLVTSDRAVRKEACEMFKLVQAYMGDRPSRLDRRHAALLVVTKCWGMQGLRDELYVQLVRQTTGNTSPRSLAAGWELMAVSLAFFAPSPKFRCYLEGYIQRHTEPSSDTKRESQTEQQVTQFILDQQDMKLKKNSKSRKKRKQNTDEEEGLPISTYAKFCHRKLQKVSITGGKKGLRKPTLEEIDHSRRAIVTPSLFGSSLDEVMERQSELFPDRKLPWVQVQLSQYVLALDGAKTEGIFRVPGDIDEVNALKLQVDQWRIPENLSDPNVPASLMKLWYRELEEPLIPMAFYKQCVSNYDDPVAAIAVVQCLPELNRLVLCYFIHFLQVFAQPANVSVTKMDVNNLAMVMAPNCLRCQSDDPRVIFENTRKEMSFLRMLIVHLDTSFVEGVV
ncbi:hypothetical protein DPEC_G00211210 [Dallia pectoralis]|uniref:Uncharacterized protein n=1 Tax=Dallia pectoralis TaxID=75939 RepID=A0ACC2G6E5_DALPE|nr:hypothetical protein DPEC_G00211210 [Dallia pectoralis]